jgi:xylulokinase
MFLGIDLGTSGVKAVVLDRGHHVLAAATAPLRIDQPQPLWREQDPAAWWRASDDAVRQALAQLAAAGHRPSEVECIGLTGQMHGATLLDAHGETLRPAILWNDGRSAQECALLESKVPLSRQITGNMMMPGFTAPKLLWVARHEPQVFERVRHVLLPKDWLRWRMTGEFATDMSDAAGTLWLDVAQRDWSDELLAACGLSRAQMPALHEGPRITGSLRADLARHWGLRSIPVVAGASDNAAGALGAGVFRPGDAMLSLGTSGVVFVSTSEFVCNPGQAVHSFCHALPQTWHLMSVMLSAASCLDFCASLVGEPDVGVLLAEAQARGLRSSTPLFLPYLNGERTPHNNPHAQAVYFGLQAGTVRADLVNATLDGVCHGLAQGIAALQATGIGLEQVSLIGGGARSGYWAQMLADTTGLVITRREEGAVGPALGAARLAWIGADNAALSDILMAPATLESYAPRPAEAAMQHERAARFASLYAGVAPLYGKELA